MATFCFLRTPARLRLSGPISCAALWAPHCAVFGPKSWSSSRAEFRHKTGVSGSYRPAVRAAHNARCSWSAFGLGAWSPSSPSLSSVAIALRRPTESRARRADRSNFEAFSTSRVGDPHNSTRAQVDSRRRVRDAAAKRCGHSPIKTSVGGWRPWAVKTPPRLPLELSVAWLNSEATNRSPKPGVSNQRLAK